MVELAAPAGEPESLLAALNCGADAVYLGLARFNARTRAANFGLDDLAQAVARCRPRGVRIYVTLNTLACDGELRAVERMVCGIAEAGADAIIVQDLGIATLARRTCPDLPLHASTQTSVGTAAGCRVLESLGVERLVLPREASLTQIRRLRERTTLELEVFVHGALCVSWSGQCTASLARGGRSGNRGACAQPCRLPYDLRVDGEVLAEGSVRHPLSPGDLMAVDRIAALVDAGVGSFKIEGRMKRPEYVASTVLHYRRVLDRLERGGERTLDESERRDLLQPFHRTPTLGYLDGPDHRALVHGRHPGGLGLRVGRIAGVEGRTLALDAADLPLKAGDGVVVEGGAGAGGRVAAVDSPPGGGIRVRMGREFDPRSVRPGQWLSRTDDPVLDRRLRLAIQGRSREVQPRRHPVWGTVVGSLGTPLRLVLDDGEGERVQVDSHGILEAARTRPLRAEDVRARLAKMGDSAFLLAGLEYQVDGEISLPPAELNRLRRSAVAELARRRAVVPVRTTVRGAADALRAEMRIDAACPVPEGLSVVCREPAQAEAAADMGGVAILIADPAVQTDAGPLLEIARDRGIFAVIALHRSQLEGEASLPRKLPAADAVLVRTLGQVGDLSRPGRGAPLALGDLTLNAINAVAAGHLLAAGLQTVAPGADLPLGELPGLSRHVPPTRIEVPLVLHLPLFHTAHCLYAARIAGAGDRRRCGDVCRHRRLELLDGEGRPLPVLADARCRNTVFDGRVRDGSDHLPTLWRHGFRRFRVELLHEGPAETRQRIAAVLRAVDDGRRDPANSPGEVH